MIKTHENTDTHTHTYVKVVFTSKRIGGGSSHDRVVER